jgi:flagellar biosynthesis protein FlhG
LIPKDWYGRRSRLPHEKQRSIMHDQASQLRSLVLRANRQAVADHAPPPQLLVVAGGKPGVGATTVAINLAVALSRNGCRTVLVDADLSSASAATYLECPEVPGIDDVLAARRDIHEILQLAPGGIQLAAGARRGAGAPLCTERSLGRLLKQIRSLGPHADAVVVDAGHLPSDLAARFWQAGDRVLLVTTADAAAVMDSYATIKTMLARLPGAVALELLVNRAAAEAVAADVHRRIDQSCQRFLGISLALRSALPNEAIGKTSAHSLGSIAPSSIAQPESPLAKAFDLLASKFLEESTERPLPRQRVA